MISPTAYQLGGAYRSGGHVGRPGSSPGTAESPADVTGRAGQEPPHPRVAEELKTPPHVRGGRVRVRERREIGADAAVGVEYGEDLPRILHRRPDLRLVAAHAGVVFRCCDLGRRHGGDLRRVEAVERLADPVPLGLNDLPDPGLEDRARQMLEEERGIVRRMVAELLEWRGQRIGRGRVPGLYPRDERRRLVVGDRAGWSGSCPVRRARGWLLSRPGTGWWHLRSMGPGWRTSRSPARV